MKAKNDKTEINQFEPFINSIFRISLIILKVNRMKVLSLVYSNRINLIKHEQ